MAGRSKTPLVRNIPISLFIHGSAYTREILDPFIQRGVLPVTSAGPEFHPKIKIALAVHF